MKLRYFIVDELDRHLIQEVNLEGADFEPDDHLYDIIALNPSKYDGFKRQIQGISEDAKRMLLSHDWPGNVRELRNAVERAMILEESSLIRPASLPMSVVRGAQTHPAPAAAAPQPFVEAGMSLEENEKLLILRAIEKTGGNQTQAAKLLKVTRDTLRYKMKKFRLR